MTHGAKGAMAKSISGRSTPGSAMAITIMWPYPSRRAVPVRHR